MKCEYVTIIGGGLAGCEAAWQLARQGVPVRLYEMRPETNTPAHKTNKLAELVCSNSLRSNSLDNAVGVLKEEMRSLGSLIMDAADANAVPAGSALAVDRELFADEITEKLERNPLVEIIRAEITEVPAEGIRIIASGPLTSDALAADILQKTGNDFIHFFDAVAPIISGDSIDFDKAFRGSRYEKGEDDYVNCPMDQQEYESFYHELVKAELHPLKEFEKAEYFEGCMPVEVMAKRGISTLLFGPLKPVGLIDKRHPEGKFHAVVQLRMENRDGTMYNLVGFQTNLKWPAQEIVFRMIPGLEKAEFLRFGSMHRNTFINSPELLLPTMQLKSDTNLLFAGQLSGVEGYVESASSGMVAGINAARIYKGLEPVIFSPVTAHGALCSYITSPNRHFQPMNVNFGLFPLPTERIREKKAKKEFYAEKALENIRILRKSLF